MKLLLIFCLFLSNLYSLDYITIYNAKGKNYLHSGFKVSGQLYKYSCKKDGKAYERNCHVELKVFNNGKYFVYPNLTVGVTYESMFKSASEYDFFTFECVYRGNLLNFKGCK